MTATEAAKPSERLGSLVSADDRSRLRLIGLDLVDMPDSFSPNEHLKRYMKYGLVSIDAVSTSDGWAWRLSLTADGRQAAGLYLH